MKYKIYEVRISKGLTQEQLAELVGVSKSTINRIENNINNIRPLFENIAKIAYVLDVPISALYEWEIGDI